jgi:uncharacterized integral membrane protein
VIVPSSSVGKIKLPEYRIHWAAKIGIIVFVIVIDFLVLVGGVSFMAYFHFGLLEIPIVVAALCYAIGGNMITYNFLKSALLTLKAKLGSKIDNTHTYATTTGIVHRDLSPDWSGVRNAASGGLAITGIFLFLIFTLIGALVFGGSQLVKLEEGSPPNSLIMMVTLVAVMAGILPLMGRISYKMGNHKVAEEFGYKKNHVGGVIVVGSLGGTNGDRTSGPDVGAGDGGAGDGGGGYSF